MFGFGYCQRISGAFLAGESGVYASLSAPSTKVMAKGIPQGRIHHHIYPH